MDLYDVMAEGCHPPLNPQQIGELFHTGRFKRDEPCRKVGATGWRTVDELFPLLKYGSGGFELPPAESRQHSGVSPFVIAGAFVGVLLLVGAAYFFWDGAAHDSIDEANRPTHHTVLPVVTRITPAPARDDSYSPTTSRVAGVDRLRINQERLEAEKRQQEELGREQAAAADRMRREAEERELAAQKAAGTNYHVSLDQNCYIPMSGSGSG